VRLPRSLRHLPRPSEAYSRVIRGAHRPAGPFSARGRGWATPRNVHSSRSHARAASRTYPLARLRSPRDSTRRLARSGDRALIGRLPREGTMPCLALPCRADPNRARPRPAERPYNAYPIGLRQSNARGRTLTGRRGSSISRRSGKAGAVILERGPSAPLSGRRLVAPDKPSLVSSVKPGSSGQPSILGTFAHAGAPRRAVLWVPVSTRRRRISLAGRTRPARTASRARASRTPRATARGRAHAATT
jgi:hypothetical protein